MANDFISRDDALGNAMQVVQKYGMELQSKNANMSRREGDMFRRIYDSLKSMTASDVVSVVRCKDCRHFGATQSYLCDLHHRSSNGEDYCSYGIRMNGVNQKEAPQNV